jgi:hypothetical protein
MTQLEQYLERRKLYIDSDGLMSPTPTHPGQRYASLNGLLYSAEDLVIQRKLGGGVHGSALLDYIVIAARCRESLGVFRRAPGHSDYAHHDDLIGLAAVLPALAEEIRSHGDKTGWQYGPVSLRFFQQDIAHFEWCADKSPPFWRQAWWYLAVTTAAQFEDQDGTDPWILSWMLLEASHAKNWLTRRAARVWRKRLYAKHPGGMRQVFSQYFGPEHPIAAFFPAGSEPGGMIAG